MGQFDEKVELDCSKEIEAWQRQNCEPNFWVEGAYVCGRVGVWEDDGVRQELPQHEREANITTNTNGKLNSNSKNETESENELENESDTESKSEIEANIVNEKESTSSVEFQISSEPNFTIEKERSRVEERHRDGYEGVGFIAVDPFGNLACAMTARGTEYRLAGRVGHAAVGGAGCYATKKVIYFCGGGYFDF
jgi:isoaspartyl peptidase/L-asparaginase-like protein (Ntn-hydrolase superfamily)